MTEEHSNSPAGFDSYWDNVDAELAALPGQPVLEELPMRSNEHCTVYALRLTSIGPYRLFGYYSVPAGDGPFPALLQTPRYGSVNHIPDYNDRLRYACLQIMHRGQRLADQPYAASYPGLLTDGIEDPDGYAFRGIVADCLRAAEFLLSRDEVDVGRVAVSGDDLALITASRRTGFATVMADSLMFYRLMEQRKRTSGYPVEEINDALRLDPDAESAIAGTVAYFDPLHHAGAIQSHVVLSVGDEGGSSGPDWLHPLVEAIPGEVEDYRLTHRGGTDHDALDALLAGRMGVEPMFRFKRHI